MRKSRWRVLNRICVALDVNIGDVMEFVSGD
ncbi:MAG: helix-turn-helix domain-containing protein [Oscillospiraceae bacterium]